MQHTGGQVAAVRASGSPVPPSLTSLAGAYSLLPGTADGSHLSLAFLFAYPVFAGANVMSTIHTPRGVQSLYLSDSLMRVNFLYPPYKRYISSVSTSPTDDSMQSHLLPVPHQLAVQALLLPSPITAGICFIPPHAFFFFFCSFFSPPPRLHFLLLAMRLPSWAVTVNLEGR